MMTMLKLFFAKPAQSHISDFYFSQFYHKLGAVYVSVNAAIVAYKADRKAKKAIKRFIIG
ncbi:hypothetical protein [Methylomonas sp. AM2-LC]|uniref:hypothetical protein n=1 Tax=Methylomonas sp. AM2-LC TaxID=3153301 RepID=UPI0032676D6B